MREGNPEGRADVSANPKQRPEPVPLQSAHIQWPMKTEPCVPLLFSSGDSVFVFKRLAASKLDLFLLSQKGGTQTVSAESLQTFIDS